MYLVVIQKNLCTRRDMQMLLFHCLERGPPTPVATTVLERPPTPVATTVLERSLPLKSV